MKLLDENIEETLQDIGLGKASLNGKTIQHTMLQPALIVKSKNQKAQNEVAQCAFILLFLRRIFKITGVESSYTAGIEVWTNACFVE